MTTPPTQALPMIATIFRGIKTGQHWCFGDPEYSELSSERFGEYYAFFQQLNLTLYRDPRGFIYAISEDEDFKGSDTIIKYVVFTAVWIDALADQAADLGKQLFGNQHVVGTLPHFASEAYRRLCQQAGILDEGELLTLLRALDRLGFVRMDGTHRFTLRESFHRLLDVCSGYHLPRKANADAPPRPEP